MRAHKGFTMVEVLTTVAIVGIVAALAIPRMRAATRNSSVSSMTFELRLWLEGLRKRAIFRQEEVVAVIVDAQSAHDCAVAGGNLCGRWVLLRPAAGFTLNGLDPALQKYPNATVLADELLARGLGFYYPDQVSVGPPPYDTIAPFDGELLGNCTGRACVGIRFRRDGVVEPEWPNGAPGGAKTGMAFVLGSELTGRNSTDETPGREHPAADKRAVIVTFPTGIVRTHSVGR
jgi:prepilin-type N-terminal cleavage/methylation domain-containing protein